MKWIAAVAAVFAVLLIVQYGHAEAGHHSVKHYRGWTAPDDYCFQLVTPPYYHNCIKAQRVIYTVFPAATRQAAMRVASCETGRTFDRWATNRYSRTAGLFQIHPGNIGRRVTWGDHHHVISHRLYNAWDNARAALYLSYGGTNWREWDPVCQP